MKKNSYTLHSRFPVLPVKFWIQSFDEKKLYELRPRFPVLSVKFWIRSFNEEFIQIASKISGFLRNFFVKEFLYIFFSKKRAEVSDIRFAADRPVAVLRSKPNSVSIFPSEKKVQTEILQRKIGIFQPRRDIFSGRAEFFSCFALFVCLLFAVGCTCSGGRNRTDIEPFKDMLQQKNIKPQEGAESGESLMRLPPEGTRARNRSYYPYAGNPDRAGRELKNYLKITPDVMAQGRMYYTRHCVYCHGVKGDAGRGASVAPRMAVPPPSLLTDKAKNYSDGRLHHIIYNGQGLMGLYGPQLSAHEQALTRYMEDSPDRYRGFASVWAVVSYVRFLQGKQLTEGNQAVSEKSP